MLLKSYLHNSHWDDLGVSRGQKGPKKDIMCPFLEKNEYFGLKICNYTLNQSRKLDFKQIIPGLLAQFSGIQGSVREGD